MVRENYKIDFVIPWVNGSDDNWLRQKEEYWIKAGNSPYPDGNLSLRFRDWNNLKYWFRGVEKCTPWVNNIFFVTWGHIPEWLNIRHPKLTIIKHDDYIPAEFLPVFSANPIEVNFHRISNLSEHFVYFNDDMFVIDQMRKEDFFYRGVPREIAAMYLLTNSGSQDTFQYMLFYMMGIINSHFDLHTSIRKNWRKWYSIKYGKKLLNNFLLLRFHNLSGLEMPHVPSALRKSTIQEVWNIIPDEMNETCRHRFRNSRDITQYIFRYWEIMKGTFEPTNIFSYSREFYLQDENVDAVMRCISKQEAKLICLNDSKDIRDFEKQKKKICSAFETIFPQKSSFEL